MCATDEAGNLGKGGRKITLLKVSYNSDMPIEQSTTVMTQGIQ